MSTATNEIARLCSVFRELDSLFRAALQRACDLDKLSRTGDSFDDWRINIRVNKSDLTDFDNMIKDQKNDLEYIRDPGKLQFWRIAMEYLAFENNGFPGRKGRIYSDGSFAMFEKPSITCYGWGAQIDEIAFICRKLPAKVIRVSKQSSVQEQSTFSGIHARVLKLDSFLERTYASIASITIPYSSLAAEIDRSWPFRVPQIEPFSQSTNVATAYPGIQDPNQAVTATVIVAFVSVISGIFALLSFQKSPPRGFWSDADFFSMCQGAIIQISGVVILIITVFFQNPLLAKQAWRWVWALAISSLVSCMVAVPLYGFVSPGWSTVLMALAGILQTWVSVMLMFIVSI